MRRWTRRYRHYLLTFAPDWFGLLNLPHDAVKHLDGKLWELRVKGWSGISRAIYVTATERRIIIVRVFVKTTQKTPILELNLARDRTMGVK